MSKRVFALYRVSKMPLSVLFEVLYTRPKPMGLALDLAAGKMYCWPEFVGNRKALRIWFLPIRRCWVQISWN